MKKILLRTRKIIEGGIISEEAYVTSKIAKHTLNRHLSLKTGWQGRNVNGCSGDEGCPPPNANGYYDCIGENCVFIPY